MTLKLELTNDEALVLFEYLQRYVETGKLDFIDQAEQRALWNLGALLEKELFPLPENYAAALGSARNRLRDEE